MLFIRLLSVLVFLWLPNIFSARIIGNRNSFNHGIALFKSPRLVALNNHTSLNIDVPMNQMNQMNQNSTTDMITIIEPPPPRRMRKLFSFLSLSVMFASWYVLSAGHNIYNVHVKSQFPFPVTTASAQLLIGAMFCSVPLYFLRLKSFPTLSRGDVLPLLPIALCNTIGHITALKAVFEVKGSLTHVIKAAEPVVQVLCMWLWNGATPRPLTALSLVPISYGVAHASTLGDLNPHRLRLEMASRVAVLAMASNVAFAMRSILKRNLSPEYKKRTGLTPSSEHTLTTLLSFLLSLPLVLQLEPLSVTWSRLSSSGVASTLYKDMLVTSVCFYLYNGIQNSLLARLDPVSTAVGSALKRVAILVGLYLFTPDESSSFPPARVVGCGIAIAGCLLYAILDALNW